MKTKLKRLLSVLLCVVMLLGAMSSTSLAASKSSDKCGKKVKWKLSGSTLTISGKGKMKNFNDISEDEDWSFMTDAPWENKKDDIKKS